MKRLATIFELPRLAYSQILSNLPEKEPRLVGKKIIPVAEPDLRGNEKKYLLSALSSTWISSAGDYVEKFEQSFAKTVSQTRFATAVNSGTSALQLALASLGIGPGDEVILPTFTMIATLNVVTFLGAKPVLIDANPLTWNLDATQIEAKITPKTKAIIVVHIYGLPVDMQPVYDLARQYKLWVIEDAAEAHGAEYCGQRVGSLGDVAAFSLYANKIITTGEGGIVTTNNPAIAKRLRLLASHAFSEDRHFWHKMPAFSFRMSNLQAAIGLAQVERFNKFINLKRLHAEIYTKLLQNLPGLTLPIEPKNTKHVYWNYGILVDETSFGIGKNELRAYLAKHGIETRSFFIPLHWQPAYYRQFQGQSFPISERLCRNGFYLPGSTNLSKSEIKMIVSTIINAKKN